MSEFRLNPPSHAPHFPAEIYTAIFHYTDERTLWRLRGCSRTVREVVEPLLVPYLAKKTLEVEPSSLPVDMYHPDAITLISESDAARRIALQGASERLANHFDAYPPAAAHLRHLVLEVRDDDAVAGWAHISRFAATLETLSISLLDRGGISSSSSREPEDVWQMDSGNPLANLCPFISLSYTYYDLANLTILHFHTTYRVLEHLSFLLYCAPNIRELAISSTAGTGGEDCDLLVDRMHDGCEKLERVSCSLSGATMSELSASLNQCETLRYLIIHITPETYYHEDLNLYGILCQLPGYEALEGLCLYGPCAMDMLEESGSGEHPGCFDRVKTLVLERQADREAGTGSALYPLLDPAIRPELSAVIRLIFVDRSGMADAYSDTSLRALFEQYSTLEQVEFISGTTSYPADPFANGTAATWAERNVTSCVTRSDILGIVTSG